MILAMCQTKKLQTLIAKRYKEIIILLLLFYSAYIVANFSVKEYSSLKIAVGNTQGIFNIFANTPTYFELYEKTLRSLNRTEDFQDILFEYLKARAKLTSGSLLALYLSESIRQIEPENNAPVHQFANFSEDVLVPFRISYPNKKWKGNQLPLLTANVNGRTGNVMGEYATLYALHRIYNVSVIMHPHMAKSLSKDFPNLSIKETLSDEDLQNSNLWHKLANKGNMFNYLNFDIAASGLFGPRMFILDGYSFEMRLFNYFKNDIKKEFTFLPQIQQQADEYLHSIRNESEVPNHKITFIGFHIRRTDYAKHMKVIFKSTLPDETYFQLALDYYRKKFQHPVFIVASDDTSFVQNSILGKQNDTFISKDKSALVDMSILASCNHSIITLGTFGFWASYLADGEVVYPVDSKQERPYRLYHKMKLPNFTPIKY